MTPNTTGMIGAASLPSPYIGAPHAVVAAAAQATQAFHGQYAAPAPESPHMERVLVCLHSVWDRLATEANALDSVAERFLGSVPSQASNGAPTPAPSSVVEHLDTISQRIHIMVDRIGEIRQRLQRL